MKNPLASVVESEPEIAALLEALPEEAREKLMKLVSALQNVPPEEAEKMLKELLEDSE